MSPEKQREIASKGGRAAHAKGTAHEWSSDEARQAGRKGGQMSRGGRGKLQREIVRALLDGSRTGELARPDVKLEMNPADAEARGIESDDGVRIFNDLGEVHLTVQVTPLVRAGTVSMPKGLWRRSTANGYTSNVLVPDTLSDIGAGACFNDARVQVERTDR